MENKALLPDGPACAECEFMESYFYVAGTLGFTLYGQIIMKFRSTVLDAGPRVAGRFGYLLAMVSDIRVLSGLAAGVLAALCWMMAVQKLSLTVAYPFMALSFVLVPITAMLLLGERLTGGQMIGAALIVLGVAFSTMSQPGPVT